MKDKLVPENPPEQSQVINEVLKKYPNLFKDNKNVKIKIMTKDSTGKSVTKFITLKAQPQAVVTPEPRINSPMPLAPGINSLKPIQKVMYTGKRGRPKKVKPGEFDPHQEERKQIEERLMRDYPEIANQINHNSEELYEEQDDEGQEEDFEVSQYTSLEQVGSQSQIAATSEPNLHQLDPSSEAEALSNVASGIAASLGLVEQQQNLHDGSALIVPSLDAPISHYQQGQAIMMENGQIHIVAQGQPL